MDRALSARDALAAAGFDLVQPFSAAAYHAAVDGRGLAPLELFGRADAQAWLVGNTRALWPRFVGAYAADASLQDAADPLDTYVERALRRAFEGARCAIRFAHHTDARLVDMLRAAEASGLAKRGPAHLAVHPERGPWFALRAVVTFDAEASATPQAAAPDPCAACDAPCVAAMQAALEGEGGWRAWLAVREACPVGGEHAYGPAQTRYHYTKERAYIVAEAGEGAGAACAPGEPSRRQGE